MAIKNLLDDFRNALSIAQAGIKGTLKSLKKTQSQAKKPTARKREVLHNRHPDRIRLSGIDCPEKGKGALTEDTV